MRMFRFLVGYAIRDLTAYDALRTTLAIVFTIAFVSAFTLGSYGLVLGVEQVGLHRVQADPLALSLWVGERGIPHHIIKPEVSQELEARLTETFGPTEKKRVFPFRQVVFSWEGRDVSQRIFGRTIMLGQRTDPLFESFPLMHGRTFDGPKDQGIIVSPEMLYLLGFDPKAPPSHLKIHTTTGRTYPIPVLGVTKHNFPPELHLYYVLPERYAHLLEHSDPDPLRQAIYTGPIGKNWPKVHSQLPDLIQKILQPRRIRLLYPEPGPNGSIIWLLQSELRKGEGRNWPSQSEWTAYLRNIHSILTEDDKQNYGKREEFITKQRPLEETELPEMPTERDLVGVYLDDPKDLPEAVEVCKTVKAGGGNLEVLNESVAKRIVTVRQEAEVALRILSVVEVILLLISIGNIFVIQALRWERKLPELGMLKAMGMSGRLLWSLCLLEGFLLSVVGAVVGLGLGWLGGHIGATWWYQGDGHEAELGFQTPVVLLVGIFTGAVVICLASSWWSAWRAGRASPARLLRLGG